MNVAGAKNCYNSRHFTPTQMSQTSSVDRLDGWQEIAGYLRKSVRSAQRWEERFGLPVRRLRGAEGEGEVVYALPAEIDQWLTSRSQGEPYDERQDPSTGESVHPPVHHQRHAARFSLYLLIAGVAAVMLVAFAVLESRRRGSSVESPAAIVIPFGPERLAAATPPRLDEGPWPAQGHDEQGTRQAHDKGPTATPIVQLFYDPERLLASGQPLAVTSAGTLLIGLPEEVRAMGADGRVRWKFGLSVQPHGVHEEATGLTVTRDGSIFVSTSDTPDDDDSHTVTFYALRADGSLKWKARKTPMHVPPAAGPGDTMLQITEYGALTSFRSDGSVAWMTHIPGFAPRMPVVDSRGRIYAASDGSAYKQRSLTALNSDGSVIWTTGSKGVLGAAVGQFDVIMTVDDRATLEAFTPEGSRLWSTNLTGKPTTEPLAIARNSGHAYVQTSEGVFCGLAQRLWKVPLPTEVGHVVGPILDVDGNVYVSAANQVCSFARDGTTRWCVPLSNAGRIVGAGPEALYVVSDNQRLYRIASPLSAAAGQGH